MATAYTEWEKASCPLMITRLEKPGHLQAKASDPEPEAAEAASPQGLLLQCPLLILSESITVPK